MTLFHVIRKCYGTGVFELIKRSPRFGILLIAICLSLIFTGLDIVASIHNFIGSTDGYVFVCCLCSLARIPPKDKSTPCTNFFLFLFEKASTRGGSCRSSSNA